MKSPSQPTGPNILEQDPVRLSMDPDSAADPSASWAVSLLREATPYQSAPGHKERVWMALPAARSYRPSRLRIAFAVAAWLVCGICASAALAQWPAWLAHTIDGIVPSATTFAPPPPVQRLRHAPGERSSVPGLVLPSEAAPVATPQPQTSDEPASAARPKRASKAAQPDDLGLLLDAMRALRVERNPVRARALLTAYLDRHPKGELAEEALVMLVEAAVAHHDSDAQALVARYHKLYPRGVFRGLVEQSAASKSP
jgi:hypothetical protein